MLDASRPTEAQAESAEAIALAEYAEHAGKLLEVNYICGYVDNYSGDWACDPPIIVRVSPNQKPSHGILHWNHEWLDPCWDVELISGTVPEDIRSLWIDGPSHNAITGERDWKGARLLTRGESLVARLKGLFQ